MKCDRCDRCGKSTIKLVPMDFDDGEGLRHICVRCFNVWRNTMCSIWLEFTSRTHYELANKLVKLWMDKKL